ncbi:hypothetical protein BO70DRAFT_359223 [Aspergillus heteromorphus CBS 117.55]|uniref:Uncharacterized protein n=1 Tax=Aspergillus heteromorphus CBS 117.55 TaxID=1448321 RepID=A0A317X139_9EURO|nr:uncharacterized protein BO70DRAFT_359223 [Aspergillus heteromorphus CBS 117.55]PWY90240.1 hypothetical protein BO70DRAFT_359223 [Aspergillus heteromorphus CBS 117.55]
MRLSIWRINTPAHCVSPPRGGGCVFVSLALCVCVPSVALRPILDSVLNSQSVSLSACLPVSGGLGHGQPTGWGRREGFTTPSGLAVFIDLQISPALLSCSPPSHFPFRTAYDLFLAHLPRRTFQSPSRPRPRAQ